MTGDRTIAAGLALVEMATSAAETARTSAAARCAGQGQLLAVGLDDARAALAHAERYDALAVGIRTLVRRLETLTRQVAAIRGDPSAPLRLLFGCPRHPDDPDPRRCPECGAIARAVAGVSTTGADAREGA